MWLRIEADVDVRHEREFYFTPARPECGHITKSDNSSLKSTLETIQAPVIGENKQ